MRNGRDRIDVAYTLIADPETDKILVVRHHDGGWSLPGGGREPGETFPEAAIRETYEEADVNCRTGNLLCVNERVDAEHVVFMMFRGTVTAGSPHLTGDEEIAGIDWIDDDEANRRIPDWQVDFNSLCRSDGVPYRVK